MIFSEYILLVGTPREPNQIDRERLSEREGDRKTRSATHKTQYYKIRKTGFPNRIIHNIFMFYDPCVCMRLPVLQLFASARVFNAMYVNTNARQYTKILSMCVCMCYIIEWIATRMQTEFTTVWFATMA